MGLVITSNEKQHHTVLVEILHQLTSVMPNLNDIIGYKKPPEAWVLFVSTIRRPKMTTALYYISSVIGYEKYQVLI